MKFTSETIELQHTLEKADAHAYQALRAFWADDAALMVSELRLAAAQIEKVLATRPKPYRPLEPVSLERQTVLREGVPDVR